MKRKKERRKKVEDEKIYSRLKRAACFGLSRAALIQLGLAPSVTTPARSPRKDEQLEVSTCAASVVHPVDFVRHPAITTLSFEPEADSCDPVRQSRPASECSAKGVVFRSLAPCPSTVILRSLILEPGFSYS